MSPYIKAYLVGASTACQGQRHTLSAGDVLHILNELPLVEGEYSYSAEKISSSVSDIARVARWSTRKRPRCKVGPEIRVIL